MSDRRAGIARTLGIARSARRRLAEASLLGAGAIGASIALMGTSAWLISRAAQHPSEASLTLAIVGVQFFGLSRGFFRYGERLVGHDAALRVLADLRVRVFERLEAVAPSGIPVFRRGDLVARLRRRRRLAPGRGVARPAAIPRGGPRRDRHGGRAVVDPPAGGGGAPGRPPPLRHRGPLAHGSSGRREESRQATVRGQLTAGVVDLVDGARELLVMGAVAGQLARIDASDGELRGWHGTEPPPPASASL